MISVAEAQSRILSAFAPLAAETVSLADGVGRVLAGDVVARLTQPPVAVSAMDGYAVRAADVARVPVTLTQIGRSAAGDGFSGAVGSGQTVRIFTGAPVPDGADAIVIQEDTDADGDAITVREGVAAGRYVRPAGLDFRAGSVGVEAGRILTPRDIGIAAAMNVPWLSVRRRPKVAILATGDEVVMPGDPLGPHQIVSSNGWALAAFVAANGGEPVNLGIAPDRAEALQAMASGAAGADLLVTTGGASVGEHELIQSALGEVGLEVDFWKIAMRPGKPLIFGALRGERGVTPLLGLPGNPVSSLVCAVVFLGPILNRMRGLTPEVLEPVRARLGRDLPENDRRQDYLRASVETGPDGVAVATPFEKQDSSMLSPLSRADGLVIRPPRAAPARAGDTVELLHFPAAATTV
ncbi:MAG: molybdopterin molybdotransferase MoeA [Bauldia litoralis]